MTRRLTNAITLLGLYLILSNNAWAQLKDNLELNIFGGGSVYQKKTYEIAYPQSVSPIPGQLRFNSHGLAGFRVGVATHGHWSEEFFWSFEPNTLHLSRGGPSPSTIALSVRNNNYGANALYYLVETESHRFLPFISAGIGGTWYHLTQESIAYVRDPNRGNLPDMDDANEIAFNYGFGFKTRSTGWLGVRFDIRDFVGRSPSFGFPRISTNPQQAVLPATSALHKGEVSVGLVFYFGKR